MTDYLPTLINVIPSRRIQRGLKAITALLLNDDNTHKAIVFGAAATPISIAGAFTTGIEISADGTTGISITSGFSGVNMISLAGIASAAGLAISGACAAGISITGAATDGIKIATGAMTDGIEIASACSAIGLNISGACGTGIKITGVGTTAALQIGVSGTPAGDFVWYGTTTGYLVRFDADGDTNGSVILGADAKGVDLTAYGATASAYLHWDNSANGLLLVGDSRIDFSSNTVAAANTDGGIIKAGTSGARVVEDTANMKFMSFYFDNGATSGDNRGMYLRQYLTGAGGGGEALRVFTTVENVAAGTAHGAHLSLNFGATGTVTGQGIAARCTLHIPDVALVSNVTMSAVEAEIYSDGSTSDPGGSTLLSCFLVVNGGDATGMADVDDDAVLFDFRGWTAAAGNMIYDVTGGAPANTDGSIKIRLPDGNLAYLMYYNAEAA